MLSGIVESISDGSYSEATNCFRWLDYSNENPVVVVFSKNSPYYADKFLQSFLLKHGTYETEGDLYDNVRSLKEAFTERSGLVDVANGPLTEDHVNRLLRKYIQDELFFQAFSSSKISRYLAQAEQVLTDFLLKDELFVGVPLVFEMAIRGNAEAGLKEREDENRENILTALRAPGHLPDLPEDISTFEPTFVPLEGQSQASQDEQRKALNICCNAIDKLFDENVSHVRSPSLHGPPGTGKSHIMFQAIAYALSKGLNCLTTALTSERAQILGGVHYHSAFCIPVEKDETVINYAAQAEKALTTLLRSPEKYCFLKRLDCIFFDELGMINSAQLAQMDHILRRVKGNNVPYGGALLFSTGDNKQIRPIEGNSVWSSNLLITSHDLLYFQNPVRCCGDENLERFIRLSRKNLPYNSADM